MVRVPGFSPSGRLGLAAIILLSATVSLASPRALAAAQPPDDICGGALDRYTLAPETRVVPPVAIVRADAGDGAITNANALLSDDGSGATIERANGGSPTIMVDFGQVVSGLLTIETLDSTSPEIRVAVSESLRYLGPDSDVEWGEQGTLSWTPPAGPSSFESGQLTFRYALVFLANSGSVTIDSLRLYFTPFHGEPAAYAGCFLSSVDRINRIWYSGAYTEELDTVPTPVGGSTIVDGAKRDRLVWSADLAVEAAVEYVTHDQPEHVRTALADLAAHQRADGAVPASQFGDYALVLDDYCAWWVIALANLVDHTGDLEIAESLYPALQRQIEWFAPHVRSDGLLVKQSDLEWSYTLSRSGAVTYLNVVYYRALRDSASIATRLEHGDDAARWSTRADALRNAINTRLFDPERGAYVDSDVDGVHIPQDANVLAIVFDIAPSETWAGILGYLHDRFWTPYGSVNVDPEYGTNSWHDRRIWLFVGYFELLARFKAGDDDGAWDLLQREWGHMLDSDPASTTWEWMSAEGEIESGFTSLAHGWSAGATAALSAYALGVRTDDAAPEIVVDPRPGDLQWARGRVPTRFGPVDVSWRQFDGGFTLQTVIPPGANARIGVPLNSLDPDRAVVLVDGSPVWLGNESLGLNAARIGDKIWIDVGAGHHDVVASNGWTWFPETGHNLTAPFLEFWETGGGVPVFGYPLTEAHDESTNDSAELVLVQYVERQRLEYHPENAGTPYAIELGRLGVDDADRRNLLESSPFATLPANPEQPGCAWFAVTGHTVCGRFLEYWRLHGLEFGDPGVSEREALALFGYPLSEPFVNSSDGLTVQYFERARFEYHPENDGTQWDVLLGRLGADRLAGGGCCASLPTR